MFYETVFRALNKARVRYLVVGGIAVVLRGSDRMTHDLDLMLDFDERNLLRGMAALEKLGLRPKVPVRMKDFADPQNRERWQREKGMVVFGLAGTDSSLMSVDVMVDHPVDFRRAYRDREVLRVGGMNVPLASVSDMIRMKQESGREQDLYDIGFLKGLVRHRRQRPRRR